MATHTDDHPDPSHDGVAARNRLARVYAEALAAAAGDRADEVGQELVELVRGVLAANPTIEAYLASPAVSTRTKQPVLDAAFGTTVSPPVRNLIGVLNQNRRLDLLRPIAAAYRDLLDKRVGRVRVLVRTAAPLSDDQYGRLKETMAARLGKEPVLHVRVEPELLGGLVVQVGDRVFDTSVRTRIQTLRAQMMERGTSYVLHQN